MSAADVTEIAPTVARIRERLERWRYATGPCPACDQSPHTGGCVLVGVMDDLAKLEKAVNPEGAA